MGEQGKRIKRMVKKVQVKFKELKIGNKLALVMIALSLVVITAVSTLFYIQFDSALKERVFLQLSSVKRLKVSQVESVLESRIERFQSLVRRGDTLTVHLFSEEWFQFFGYFDGFPASVGGYKLESLDITLGSGDIVLQDLTGGHPEGMLTIGVITYKSGRYIIGISSLPEVQEVMYERTGLGLSGESFIVGRDYRLRTKSRFYPDRKPMEILAETPAALYAFSGRQGESILKDYREVKVFTAFQPIRIKNLEFAMLSEIDYEEALMPLRILRRNIFIILLIVFLFVFIASYQISIVVVRPVISMKQQLNAMSQGVINSPTYNPERTDEIGQMFIALDQLVRALNQTIDFAGKIGNGQFDAHYDLLSSEDRLGEALLLMKSKLKDYQETERKLIKENQQSLISGQELERSRLSKEMHDGLGPLLTSIRLKIQALDLRKEDKIRLTNELDDTIREVRRMSNNLMPSVLTDFGAGEAIGNLVQQIKEDAPMQILYKNAMNEALAVSDDINIALYRIAQESLNNAIKHSRASEVKISVTQFEDHLSFYISDNGIGFDVNGRYEGHGLRNLRERVKLLNGTIYFDSGNEGTTIEAEIPTK